MPWTEEVELGQHLRNFREKLTKHSDEYKLGKVVICSNEDEFVPPSIQRAEGGQILHHRLDWLICDVKKERLGKNRFRHPAGKDLNSQDFDNEITNPYGVGEACQDWREFKCGEEVYYVGSFSGYREGKISPVHGQFKHENGVSQEWYIVPSETVVENDVQGDSGAWVLSKIDHKVLGLLWGYSSNTLLFTPIHEIFRQISVKMNNAHVQVAPLDPDTATQPTSAIPISRSAKRPRVRSLFGNKAPIGFKAVLTKPGTEVAKPHPPPIIQGAIGAVEDSSEAERIFKGDGTPSRSCSPTPSLASSISSAADSPSPCLRPLQLQRDLCGDVVNPLEKLDIRATSPQGDFDPIFNDGRSRILQAELLAAA